MKEALYYKKIDHTIHCQLCPHFCKLKSNQVGRCNVRKNIEGTLYSLNYGKVSAIQVDPIEKKPIHEFMQGTNIFSIGSYGCNMKCMFCQNYDISMEQPEVVEMTPDQIVEKAIELRVPSIAYTYNEPTIFYEMMLETAMIANEHGLKNVIVTNGLINEAPLRALLPYIDAMNIDLKTYSDKIYQTLGATKGEDVLNTIKIAAGVCHVEVTILVVPGVSDDIKGFEILMSRLKASAPNIVLHLSRYFPRYLYEENATDIVHMLTLKEMAIKYFDKVYLGNV